MWEWISNFFSGVLSFLVPFMGKKKGKLLFVGLDQAGKSSLLYRLKEDKMASPHPTARPTCESLQFGNITFTTYDLGGHEQARRIWKDYFPACDGVVFIIDGVNKARFHESKYELQKLLQDPDIADVAVAVLVNKIDVPGCVNEHQIICEFDLYDKTTGTDVVSRKDLKGKRPLAVFPVSVLQRQGYGKAFTWLANFVE